MVEFMIGEVLEVLGGRIEIEVETLKKGEPIFIKFEDPTIASAIVFNGPFDNPFGLNIGWADVMFQLFDDFRLPRVGIELSDALNGIIKIIPRP